MKDAEYEYSNDRLLYEAGALIKDGNNYAFTNGGLLFFATNPQRVMSWSYIRLLRFEVNNEHRNNRGLPSFEKKFTGSITKQIRDIRTFFKESGFFKLYQKRNPDGGFSEEPEYPYIAIDEAIVNAVAHRDYAIQLPIECELYKDAFVVKNGGRILQREQEVPPKFRLDDQIILNSMPRNPRLIEWLKIMREKGGSAFVRALSEGTKRMRDEMKKFSLPAPFYIVNRAETTLILYSNSAEREARFSVDLELNYTNEFANLFSLKFILENGNTPDANFFNQRLKYIISALKDGLIANGWYIDSEKFSRLVAHRKSANIPQKEKIDEIVRFYQAYSFQIRQYWGDFYLSIDLTLQVKNVQLISQLLRDYSPDFFINKTAVASWQGNLYHGKIIGADSEYTNLHIFDFDKEVQLPSHRVIPSLHSSIIEEILRKRNIEFNLSTKIKELSLASKYGAAKTRYQKIQATAKDLSENIFKPLTVGGMQIFMEPSPTSLSRLGKLKINSLLEPSVEFNRHYEAVNIREGITQFGAYSKEPQDIEIVPICPQNYHTNMENLIKRLKVGKYKYKGSERTFSTRFKYSSIITPISPEKTLDECKRLLSENPNWIRNQDLNRIFLIYTPKKGYSLDDENSPYYKLKRFFFEQGIPCQMLDSPTLKNPDYKDLNLALNIVAKCGVTPWVLPDAIPDADFFIGLSYTQNIQKSQNRLMGYANVFNNYGRWKFYAGNTQTFPYEKRTEYFRELTFQTLKRLEQELSETPNIYFHYSARFSKEDCKAILEAARSVRPQGTYSFVWINRHHNIRLYDRRPETDGSLSRGSYIETSPYQIYLSTTGYNPYRKSLGTPKPLEITIWKKYPQETPQPPPDLKALAVQILSLTKLNWASTDSLCGEPITTKYAGDIAYLTAAFLRQSDSFSLHSVLEKTPWFI